MTQAPALQPDRVPLVRALALALADIKLAHSVFALPFALAAAVIAGADERGVISWGPFAGQLALVALCMVTARTWAMLINRLADRTFDAENPRTQRRALASGALSSPRALLFAGASAGLFTLACAGFWLFFDNPWPTILALPVLAWIALYSYTKRFTALCHLFLGGALAISPLASAIAIGGTEALNTHAGTLIPLSGFVLFWVAGFDVAYALQDLDYDRERGLHSIPAALGWRGALWASRALHATGAMLLLLVPTADERLGSIGIAGVTLTIALLGYEHLLLARRGLAGLPMVFFTINGIVSLLFGTLIAIDVLI